MLLYLSVLALALFCIALLPSDWQSALEYRRELILHGEIWRLWSGHLVHFGRAHAFYDGAAFIVMVWALHRLGYREWQRLLGVAPVISLGLLWLQPGLESYRGLSALDMTLFACCLRLGWNQHPRMRTGFVLLAMLLAVKLASDAFGLRATSLPDGVDVAVSAHLLGVVLGGMLLHPGLSPGHTSHHMP